MGERARSRTWIWIFLVGVLTALGAWFAALEEGRREDALEATLLEPMPAGTDPSASENTPAVPIAGEGGGNERSPVATDSSNAPKILLGTRRGLVLDTEGRPVPALSLLADGRPSPMRTDALGAFEVVGVPRHITPASSWALVRSATEESGERLLIVSSAVPIAGRVESGSGAPLHWAHVEVAVPSTAFTRFTRPLDRTREEPIEASTDADGRFSIAWAPNIPGAEIRAHMDGYRDFGAPAPALPTIGFLIQLEPWTPVETPGTRGMVLEGVVLHADLSPAAGATVRLEPTEALSDENGAFRLAVADHTKLGTPLLAFQVGFQAAVIPEFGRVVARGNLAPVRLVLGDRPLSIAGRVVDAEGHPKSGWTVALHDGTVVDADRVPPPTVEALLAEGGNATSTTDRYGAFRLTGLSARDYRVQAWSGAELVKLVSEPIAAGRDDVRLVVPADARIAKLFGRVVGRDNKPVAGVEVRVALVVFRTETGYSMEHSAGVKTDSNGAFEIHGVPRLDGFLDFGGDAIVPTQFEYAETDEGHPIQVEVERRCHFRVQGVPTAVGAVAIQFLDATGQSLMITEYQAGYSSSSSQHPLNEGATSPLSVSEDAATIVFLGVEDSELARKPVRLVPGSVTVIDW